MSILDTALSGAVVAAVAMAVAASPFCVHVAIMLRSGRGAVTSSIGYAWYLAPWPCTCNSTASSFSAKQGVLGHFAETDKFILAQAFAAVIRYAVGNVLYLYHMHVGTEKKQNRKKKYQMGWNEGKRD